MILSLMTSYMYFLVNILVVNNDMDGDNDIDINVEDIFTMTRSGRTTTNWRASSFL